MGGWRFGGCILGPRSDGGRWLEHGWGFSRQPASCKFKQSFSFYSNSALTENVIRWSHNLATELWRKYQDISSCQVIFFATICPENIFACFHIGIYSNLMLFVLDMMNIHDPGVPAASGQCYVICSQQGLLISRKALMTFEVFDVVYQSCLYSK